MAGNLEQPSVAESVADIEYPQDPIQAAARLLAEHGAFIRTLIRMRVRDPVVREDLFQEVFVRLIEEPVPANVTNVRGYLYRAIVHDSLDLARRQENYSRNLKKYAETAQNSIHKQPSRDAIVEETQEKDSLFAHLVRYVCKREAQVITLRYRDGYSIAEIADALGLHRRTVSRYLTSGLRGLRRMLAVE